MPHLAAFNARSIWLSAKDGGQVEKVLATSVTGNAVDIDGLIVWNG